MLSLAVLAAGSSLTAQNPGSAAGTITALIPKDYIQRGRSSFEAQKGADVLWLDTVRTEQGGRVRVTLTDGSILNVGSSSQLKIIKQDAASEQSQLELIYGKVRADVVKRTRPDGEFKIRTGQAVAGVIGTGEYLNATPTETTVLAINGAVAVTSNNPTIAGTVILFPGEITTVQTNRPPAPKRKATDEEIEEAFSETATLPRVKIEPNSAGPGTAIAAVIRGEGLAGATAVTFSQAGLTAALGESTAESLAITLTVADNVPVGSYSFVVSLADGSEAEGRLTVQPPQVTAGGGSQGLLDVHLPPDAVITGDWYFDRQQPPEPITTGQLSVVQGALLRLNATESRSAEGHPIRQFEWEIENTLLRGAGPNFEIDTWRLERGSYSVWLRVTDDDGHSARTEWRLGVEPVPDPALLIADCIVGGNEAQDVTLFMSCFSPEFFRLYPILEESTRNFFQTAAEIRVYYRIDNQQVQRDVANFQVTLELSFTTQDNPTVVQQRRESLTLRMALLRSRSSAEWKIIDFSSRGAGTGSDTGSETLTPDFTLTLDIDPAVGVTVRAGGEPTIINISVEPLGSFGDLVQLSVRNLPTGVEASFDPPQVPAGNSATLTLSAPLGTPAGVVTAVIVGRSGGLERTADLRVEVQAAAQPAINVSPTSLSFGNVLVGTTSAGQTVTVTNTGTADLSVSSITLSGNSAFALSLPGLPATLAPSASLTFDVTFSPAALGLASGTVTVASNAGSPTVSLTGTGIAPAISLSTNSLDFGSVLVGTTSAGQTVTVTNSGSADLIVSSITLSGSSAFALSMPGLPATLAPSTSLTFDVTFSPAAVSLASGTVTVASDAGSPTVSLTGTGMAPGISLSASVLDFGNVLVGSISAAPTVTVTNTGTADLTVSSITLSGSSAFALSLPGLPATLAPSASLTFDVTFSPAATGPASGTITIVSNAGSPTVSLSGSGTPPPNSAPNAVDDGVALDEDTSALINVLANDSDPDGDSLSVTSVTQGTNGSVSFTASNVTYTPNLNFNGSDSFTYTISDGQGGSDSATVTVTVNAVNDAPVAVNDSYSTSEDTLLAILAASGVLANDSDVDG
ncbi:MAG: choice-of-anchor D domain-containing protein, partial [Acidobacteria bacterium]|nr:choice-of-anchor D domain-containing protein [Acidobacteriota bacterium]